MTRAPAAAVSNTKNAAGNNALDDPGIMKHQKKGLPLDGEALFACNPA